MFYVDAAKHENSNVPANGDKKQPGVAANGHESKVIKGGVECTDFVRVHIFRSRLCNGNSKWSLQQNNHVSFTPFVDVCGIGGVSEHIPQRGRFAEPRIHACT